MKRFWAGLRGLSVGFATFVLFQTSAHSAVDSFLVLSPPITSSNQVQFTLTGEGLVSYVIETSSNLRDWSAAGTNASAEITRLITAAASTNDNAFYRVWRAQLPLFSAALVARSNIFFNGSQILFDSYDSADPNYSTAGMYNPAKPKAGGDVLCAEGHASLSNSIIHGKLRTGPTGSFSIGPYGSVSSLLWSQSNTGIQPGYYDDNFRFALPDVAPPFQTGELPVGDGTNLWVLGSSNYKYDGNFSAHISQTISVTGHAMVYVTGNVDIAGTISIASGASLRLYVGGATAALRRVNTDMNVSTFRYYGLPTNKSLSWSGSYEYVGTIYAPQAILTINRDSIAPADFMGSCVVEAATLNDHLNFHYDENLKINGPMR